MFRRLRCVCVPLCGFSCLLLGLPVQAGGAAPDFVVSVLRPEFESVVEVTPEGGSVPYQISARYFDSPVPLIGIAGVVVDLNTELGVPQQPLTTFGPEFASAFPGASLGTADGDDILAIGGHMPPDDLTFGLGTVLGPPLLVGTGEFIVPPSPAGTTFRIRAFVVEGALLHPSGFVSPVSGGFTGPPLDIVVIPEPSAIIILLTLVLAVVLTSRKGGYCSLGRFLDRSKLIIVFIGTISVSSVVADQCPWLVDATQAHEEISDDCAEPTFCPPFESTIER